MSSPPMNLTKIRQLLAQLDQIYHDHPELGASDPARYHDWLNIHLQEEPIDGTTESLHRPDATLQPDDPDTA